MVVERSFLFVCLFVPSLPLSFFFFLFNLDWFDPGLLCVRVAFYVFTVSVCISSGSCQEINSPLGVNGCVCKVI